MNLRTDTLGEKRSFLDEGKARVVTEFQIGHHAASHTVGDGFSHALAG